MIAEPLPRYPYEPESAWCCLACGPSKPGVDCDQPDPHGEFGLIAEVEAEAAPVRECPLCPPFVSQCAHYDGRAVWLILADVADAGTCSSTRGASTR